jgi:hypothetical protein
MIIARSRNIQELNLNDPFELPSLDEIYPE